MILSLPNILTTEELDFVRSSLQGADFVDGKLTAGWHAKLVKQNQQLKREAVYTKELTKLVKDAIQRHPAFQIAIRPKVIHSLLFSRYESGMSYGRHVDNALMGSDFFRSDVSLTLFLSDPSSYEGGELVIENTGSEQSFKLEAGSILLYPSSFLHRVETVTKGTRLVVVAWVQSLIRDASERELLFELDTARRSLFEKHGKTPEFDLISKTQANLLRKWADN